MGATLWAAGLLGLAWLVRLALRRRGRRPSAPRVRRVAVLTDDPNAARVVAEAWLSGRAVMGTVGDDGVLRTRQLDEEEEPKGGER